MIIQMGGIVFTEYTSDIYDWNIKEYSNDDLFAIFDNMDILQMIQTLTKGLKINLKAWFEDDETTD